MLQGVSYKKILIIRFSSIGDIILCSPIFRTIKTQLGAEVHWLTKKKFKFIHEFNPYIDKIHPLDDNFTELATELKKENYDLVVDLHKNLRSLRFIRRIKAPHLSFNKINIQKWLLVNFQFDSIKEPRHLVNRYFHSLMKIGIENDNLGLEYHYGQKTVNPIQEKKYIVYGIGGTYNTKKMPPEQIVYHFGNLPCTLVLLGGKTEVEAAAFIKDHLGDNCINMVNICNLHTSAKIIEDSIFVISHDTATMHIAAAFKKPILSIWGATSPSLGMDPYLPEEMTHKSIFLENKSLKCHPCSKLGSENCPKGHFKCLNDLPGDYVNIKVNQIIKIANESNE